jgi:hypothetical protein
VTSPGQPWPWSAHRTPYASFCWLGERLDLNTSLRLLSFGLRMVVSLVLARFTYPVCLQVKSQPVPRQATIISSTTTWPETMSTAVSKPRSRAYYTCYFKPVSPGTAPGFSEVAFGCARPWQGLTPIPGKSINVYMPPRQDQVRAFPLKNYAKKIIES